MLPIEKPLRRVLVLAYNFPPMMGGEVVRIHAFVKYLPRFGYLPHIVTIDPKWYGEAGFDDSLLAQYAAGVEITRTPSLMPAGQMAQAVRADVLGWRRTALPFGDRLKPVLRSIYRATMIPDETILWLPHAVRAGLLVAKRWRPDVVLATTPPHGVGVIGAVFSRLIGVPYILDVRDDWVGNPLFAPRSGLRLTIDCALESLVLRTARRVVAVTAQSQQLIRQKAERLEPEFCQIIPNGFDPEVFSKLEVEVNARQGLPPRQGRVRIVYAGGVPQKRSPESLFRTLHDLIHKNPSLENELEILFVGNMRREFQEMVANLGLAAIVTYGGFRPQSEVLRLLRSADVGLVIIPPEEGSATAIPGKVYEYMAAGLYVLALADPASALGCLVRELALGAVVPQNDPEAIAAALTHIIVLFRSSRLAPNLPPDVLNRYSRREHARQLAELFDGVIGQASA